MCVWVNCFALQKSKTLNKLSSEDRSMGDSWAQKWQNNIAKAIMAKITARWDASVKGALLTHSVSSVNKKKELVF